MSQTQNLRWKRKALAVAAVAVSFAGYAAVGSSTVSAGNYGEWDCSEIDPYATAPVDECTVGTDAPDETYPDDTYPDDTYPDDSVPVDSVPDDTYPDTTDPVDEVDPPVPTVQVLRDGVPSVAGSGQCTNGSGTINLTLANATGDLPVNFVVTHPVSGASSTVNVPAASSKQLMLIGAPAGTVLVSITSGSTNLSRTFEISCTTVEQPTVAPLIVTADPTLPVTGRNSALPTACIAIGLLGAGTVALAFARRGAAARDAQS